MVANGRRFNPQPPVARGGFLLYTWYMKLVGLFVGLLLTLILLLVGFYYIAMRPAQLAGAERLKDYLPDPILTPGVLDTSIAQENITSTICVRGYASSKRVGVSAQKEKSLREYERKDAILDHLVPISLGGHPSDPKNLWAQDVIQSKMKDRLEYALYASVCSGSLSLTDAQNMIALNWYKIYVANELETKLGAEAIDPDDL